MNPDDDLLPPDDFAGELAAFDAELPAGMAATYLETISASPQTDIVPLEETTHFTPDDAHSSSPVPMIGLNAPQPILSDIKRSFVAFNSADAHRLSTLEYAAHVAQAIASATLMSGTPRQMTNPDDASSHTSPSASDQPEQHIIFTLDEASYALPLANMLAIERPLATTALPFAPAWNMGIANLRGDIIFVVDLRLFFGLSAIRRTRSSRVIVARAPQSDSTSFGLLVDGVHKIQRLAPAQIIQSPTAAAPVANYLAPYMRGMYKGDHQALVLLDAERLLHSLVMGQQVETASAI